MIRLAGAIAWDLLLVAGLLRAVLAIVAAASHPDVLRHVNSAGVPAWAQFGACLTLATAASATWGRHRVRRSWATLWAVGAGEFGSSALILSGWSVPSLLPALWVLLPTALIVTVTIALRPIFRQRLHRRLTLAADAALASVAVVLMLNLRSASAGLQAGFWAAVVLSAAASVLALRRRPDARKLPAHI